MNYIIQPGSFIVWFIYLPSITYRNVYLFILLVIFINYQKIKNKYHKINDTFRLSMIFMFSY